MGKNQRRVARRRYTEKARLSDFAPCSAALELFDTHDQLARLNSMEKIYFGENRKRTIRVIGRFATAEPLAPPPSLCGADRSHPA